MKLCHIRVDLIAPVFATPGGKYALATDGAVVRNRIGEKGIAVRT
ncbi:hypothetical protein GCM10023169_11410 [Georgenia halophila]|uniref:MBL fold metallo-hydrolase n=1 Tax=Georgenia halophila TaxID=620889 RepID=A0ABP8KVA3_9MICO